MRYAIALALGIAIPAFSQAPTEQNFTFEVASIKPSNSGRHGMSIETGAGRFKAINATVSLVRLQYQGLSTYRRAELDRLREIRH